MTSSYQAPTFQSSARPVDTFVRQSTVPLIKDDGFTQLTKALSIVNPVLNNLLEKQVEKEQLDGTNLALDELNNGNVSKLSNNLKKKGGKDAAQKYLGGSIFTDTAYQKSKATLAGKKLKNELENDYSTAMVESGEVDSEGNPVMVYLNTFSQDSEQYQNWKQSKINNALANVENLKPAVVNKFFMPELQAATFTIDNHHIEQNQKYKFQLIKQEIPGFLDETAVLFAEGKIEEGTKFINDFIQGLYDVGLTGDDANDTYKQILDGVFNKSQLLIDPTRPEQNLLAQDFPELILSKIKYGNKDLTSHPDYLEKAADHHTEWSKKYNEKLKNERKFKDEIYKSEVANEYEKINQMQQGVGVELANGETESKEAFFLRKKDAYQALLNNRKYTSKEVQDYIQELGQSDNAELLNNIIPSIETKILRGQFADDPDKLNQAIADAENNHGTMDDEAIKAISDLKNVAKSYKDIGQRVQQSLTKINSELRDALGTSDTLLFNGSLGFKKNQGESVRATQQAIQNIQKEVIKWYQDELKKGNMPSLLDSLEMETNYAQQLLKVINPEIYGVAEEGNIFKPYYKKDPPKDLENNQSEAEEKSYIQPSALDLSLDNIDTEQLVAMTRNFLNNIQA